MFELARPILAIRCRAMQSLKCTSCSMLQITDKLGCVLSTAALRQARPGVPTKSGLEEVFQHISS